MSRIISFRNTLFFSKVFIGFAALFVSKVSVFAFSDDVMNDVSSQFLKCLTMPAEAPETYSMMAVVVLKEGRADVISINFLAPPSDWGKLAAPVVADAITKCEPYGNISQRVEFAVTPELV